MHRTFAPDPAPLAGCSLRAVCRAWRRDSGCESCRRNPARTSSALPTSNVVQRRPRMAERAAEITVLVGRPEWRVHHELPNRTRFKLASPAPRSTSAAAVEHAVGAVSGVQSVEFTPGTGSLLVHHDGSDATRREVRRALAGLRLDALPPAPRAHEAAVRARNDAVKGAVLSLLTAALPPAPRAALTLVQSIRAAGGR